MTLLIEGKGNMANENDILAQYGANNIASDNSKSLRDKIYDKFRPTDFIRVINIDTVEFAWVYTDPADEIVEQPDRYTRRVTHGQPKVFKLKPGESRVIPGHMAYIMLEAFYKTYIQHNFPKVASVMNDPAYQEKILNEVIIGAENALDIINSQNNKETITTIDDELGLTDGDSDVTTAGSEPKAPASGTNKARK